MRQIRLNSIDFLLLDLSKDSLLTVQIVLKLKTFYLHLKTAETHTSAPKQFRPIRTNSNQF